MLRIDRHIEILLMKYDCVVLPQLGGFVKHHVSARLNETGDVMLPPREVVGFNPQLTVNDSLLVQSYVETYDYSYPEAVCVVDDEVAELREELLRDGRYELGTVGELTLSDDGGLKFEPAACGILVPQLYGLGRVDVVRTDHFKRMEAKSEEMPENIISINQKEAATDDFVVRIPRRTLRWAIAACVAIMLVASIPFISRNVDTKQILGGIDLKSISSLVPVASTESTIGVAEDENTTLSELSMEALAEDNEKAGAETSVGEYTIVLASKVSEANATHFVDALGEQHVKASVMPQGQLYRVVSGDYSTMDEAQQARQSLARENGLADAWVARRAEL